MTAGADLILDAALKDAGQDRFEHEAIAGVVADLALNAPPPINIALFGPWGSGKSSFFGLLQEKLSTANSDIKIARYDAWKYGGRALKKHFVGSVAEQLDLGGDDFERDLAHDREVVRLDLWAWAKENKKSLFVGAGMAALITIVWFFLVSAAIMLVNWDAGFSSAMRIAITTVGTVLSLSFAALLFGPKVLETAVYKVKESAPETDDEFAKSFQRLVEESIDAKKGERLVVFIDELDRCSPKDVVATLIDLKTFLDVDGCIFIVAADREVLERSLREVPQANPVRDEDPYYSTPGAFLDKVFQHQIPLPPLRPQALTRFARQLVEKQEGLWGDLRRAQPDDRLFLRVVYGLVPVHVRSPRRVKVLLNNYATNVRIAQARGVNWIGRAEELATLTVLETEFPSVAADLVRFPSLLKYLRDPKTLPPSKAAQDAAASYLSLQDVGEQDGEADAYETPVAGDLLVDRQDDVAATRRANKTLIENLLSYLRKIEASGIDDPRPDLLYLQSVGANEGIDNPDLAEIIDFAADYSASDVVARFSAEPSSVVATGVRLLAQQADAERGPGRISITESVCRLTERLDPVDVQVVAPVVAGTVLAEASSPDWPAEATPGALILGVVGASKPLVEALLTRQDAETMARSGVLGRVASVLTYASGDQAALVHTLLGSAYYLHPEPLHEALTTTPSEIALSLWQSTADDVNAALKKMDTPLPAPTPAANTAAARAAAALVAANPEPRPDDSPAERFESLLTAVESRTDDQSEPLISAVLCLGQDAQPSDVRAAASDRAESTIERITDPALRNQHAMLGLKLSPIHEAAWWGELLTNSEPAPGAYEVFERLVDALAKSTDKTTARIAEAIPAVIPHIPEGELSSAAHWIGLTLGKTPWSTSASAPTAENRAAIFAAADALRPRLTSDDDSALDKALASDLVSALDVGTTSAHVGEVLEIAGSIRPAAAVEVESQLAQRATTADDVVPTLRLRILSAARGSRADLTAADLLATKGNEGDSAALNEWLALDPPLSEATQVLGAITVNTGSLDRYAAGLDLTNRTALWIALDTSAANWTQRAFQGIGKNGLNSVAVEHIAAGIAAATQQAQRDSRIDRLETAKLVEQPQHRAATDLVLQLLETGIGGDVALAARVALLSGGAAYGKTMQVRSAFDAAVTAKPNALSKSQHKRLLDLGFLTMSPKKRRRGPFGILLG